VPPRLFQDSSDGATRVSMQPTPQPEVRALKNGKTTRKNNTPLVVCPAARAATEEGERCPLNTEAQTGELGIGDRLQALPGKGFIKKSTGNEVYAEGDFGRVESFLSEKGKARMVIIWARTGETSTGDPGTWTTKYRLVKKAEVSPLASLERVASSESAKSGEEVVVLEAGMKVVVKDGFKSDGEDRINIERGISGTVSQVDEEGDAAVDFEGVSKLVWVRKQNFKRLEKAPFRAGQKVERRACGENWERGYVTSVEPELEVDFLIWDEVRHCADWKVQPQSQSTEGVSNAVALVMGRNRSAGGSYRMTRYPSFCERRPKVAKGIGGFVVIAVGVAIALAILRFMPSRSGLVSAFRCQSPFKINTVARYLQKGLAIDDLTLSACPSRVPTVWPNTDMPVGSMRLLKAWDPRWPINKKDDAWYTLANFTQRNAMRVLVGTQITCNEKADDADWKDVLSLLQLLGRGYVMGVTIGNDLDAASKSCVDKIWSGGYLLRKFHERLKELDDLPGFDNVPVTSAFGEAIFGAWPFRNDKHAMVLDFVKEVLAKYGARWVYSINVYPYFDPKMVLDPGTTDKCTASLQKALCWSDPKRCSLAGTVKTMRDRMRNVSTENTVLWITETGWSTPIASSLSEQPMSKCPAFSSYASFQKYYSGFLSWDMRVSGEQGADHVFYSAARDSPDNFGQSGHFGLMSSCESAQCKLQQDYIGPLPAPTPPPSPPTPTPSTPTPTPPTPTPPTPTPPTPRPPTPTPQTTPTPPSAKCSAHPKCKGLSGNCCPAPTGVFVACCGSTSPASCAVHPGCATLPGNCCPQTPGGTNLSCCSEAARTNEKMTKTLTDAEPILFL